MPKFRVSPTGEYQIADTAPIESAPHVRIYPSAPIVVSAGVASSITIDPISGLAATTIQGAIEEIFRGYVHDQAIASDIWVINHNQNRYPDVVAVDSAGDRVFGQEQYLSPQTVQIVFGSMISGKAFI